MSDYWIGPVKLVDLYEPSLTFTGTPTALGLQPGQITGQTEWWQAHQLKELVNNPHRRVTIGGQSGVLEPIYFSDPMLGPQTSWCLLQSFQLGQADQSHSLQGTTGLVPYTLTLAQIGDGTQRQVVVARSARDKGNDFAVTASSIVAVPFGEDDFAVDPGGTLVTREFDPIHAQPSAALGPEGGAAELPVRVGTLSDSTDDLALVALPSLESSTSGPPGWLTRRGGDARAYDRRQMAEVYGPSHRFAGETDLQIRNGRLRCWVGNAGLPPFLTCSVFRLGLWRAAGFILFDDPSGDAVLRGARLVRVRPDVVTIALSVQGKGDVLVSLRKGERMLRVVHGAGGIDTARRIRWTGLPPWSRLVSAGQGTGKYGKGVTNGDFALRWPGL
jgi:hypothetical protein